MVFTVTRRREFVIQTRLRLMNMLVRRCDVTKPQARIQRFVKKGGGRDEEFGKISCTCCKQKQTNTYVMLYFLTFTSSCMFLILRCIHFTKLRRVSLLFFSSCMVSFCFLNQGGGVCCYTK